VNLADFLLLLSIILISLSFSNQEINLIGPLINQNSQSELHRNSYKRNKITETSSPISINGNSDFAIKAASNGWPGNGSASNPYILENLVITTSVDYIYAISIRYTNVHFILRNSTITATGTESSALYLISVHNGTIYNNTAITQRGFVLSYSSSNTLINNSIINGGLWIAGCTSSTTCFQTKVEGNTVNGKPLIFWQHVTNQSVPGNAGQIILVNSSFITIKDQVITNSDVAIQLHLSANNTICNNTVNYNTNGFYLDSSSNNSLNNNTANFNTRYGFWLESSTSNSLSNNTANFNSESGFYLYHNSNNSLSNNTANNNTLHGFDLWSSQSNTLINNSIINGGLNLYCSSITACSQIKVEGNSVNGKSLIFWQHVTNQSVPENAGQIFLVNSSFITIKDQIITNTNVAIQLYFSANNTIYNNTANYNTNIGFSLRSSSNNTMNNNTANYNYRGFYYKSSSNNSLSNNTANFNSYGGFILINSSNFNLSNNTANYNTYSGFSLSMLSSKFNILSYNTANYNTENGFELETSFSNLTNNMANYNTENGFELTGYNNNNVFSNNTANSNSNGFYLSHFSKNNNFSLNYIGNNTGYGIYISIRSLDNRITNNTFINNHDTFIQAYSAERSTIFTFNYWSDHLSPDADNDGIVDIAYVIDGPCSCQDNTPVTIPYHEDDFTTTTTPSGSTSTLKSNSTFISSSRFTSTSRNTSVSPGFAITTLLIQGIILIPLINNKRGKKREDK
jgi:parallel beta-helix repeat protein